MNLYFRYLGIILSILVFGGQAIAQRIINEKIFPVDGYSVFEEGYPAKVAEGKNGSFVFLEYWAEGVEGHRNANYYLQNYGIHNFSETWFKPVTKEGFEGMQISDLKRMDNGYAVLGYQYISELRQAHAVVRFFGLDGTPVGDSPIQISNYEKRPKQFDDRFVMSDKKKLLMWVGNSIKQLFLSVRRDNGKLLWEKEMGMPVQSGKYRVTDALLDDEGNPTFLLSPSKPTYTLRDSLTPPLIVRYFHEKDSVEIDTVRINALAYLANVQMGRMGRNEIIVTGALVGNAPTGISNGGKIDKVPQVWTHVFVNRYKPEESGLTLSVSKVSEIPAKITGHYQEKGANFSLAKLVLHQGSVALLYEEHWASKDRVYFYDVACLGFNGDTGEQTWSRIIKKKQRGGENAGAFLGYVSGIARDRLRIVYLTERGAPGKIMCASIDMKSGERKDKMLASNEEARFLFFPNRSGMVGGGEMVLIGMGNPDQNDFKLITIGF